MGLFFTLKSFANQILFGFRNKVILKKISKQKHLTINVHHNAKKFGADYCDPPNSRKLKFKENLSMIGYLICTSIKSFDTSVHKFNTSSKEQ